MERLLLSDRAKWIFIIILVAIGAGLTANNFISYPNNCNSQEKASKLNH